MRYGDTVWCSHSDSYAIRLEAEWMGKVPWDNDSGHMHVVRRKDAPMCFEYVRPAVDSIEEYIDRQHFHLSDGSVFDINGNETRLQDVDPLKYVDPVWIEGDKINDCGRVLDPKELVKNYLRLLDEGDAF